MNEKCATVMIKRSQDGEIEENEYAGKLREVNGRLCVIFTDIQEDGSEVRHLLKVDPMGMEWIRSGSVKNKAIFRAGERLPFFFATAEGVMGLELTTHEYSYTKKDMHRISMSYIISQGGCPLSEYETEIVILD